MNAAPRDILIAGGGPAGAVAARVLAKAGADVTVVDAGRRPGPRVGESLLPAARRILRELDLLRTVEGHLTCPGNVAAWSSDELEASDFIRGLDGPGWQLDRTRFDAMLLDAATAAGVRLLRDTRALDARRDDCGAGWSVTLSGTAASRAHRCDFLVDATGRGAYVARVAGARAIRDDAQVAWIACYACADDDCDARTLVEAVISGWWYTSLVPGHRRIAGFVTAPRTAGRMMRSAADFAARVGDTTHVAARLRGARLLFGPRATDASSRHLEPAAGPGWLAVGDAALAFDPLSSQGLFNALYTGMQGARAILASDPASYIARLAAIRDAYHYQRAMLLAVRQRSRSAEPLAAALFKRAWRGITRPPGSST